VGCVITGTTVCIAAAGIAQSEPFTDQSASGVQGWGKNVESSSSAAATDGGVWAVDAAKSLGTLSARSRKVAVDGPEGLGLGPVEAVTVVDQGKAHDVVTDASTVGELLSAMRIEPDGTDRIDPPPSTPLSRADRITFSTARTETRARIESSPVRPAVTVSDRLPAGASQVLTPGRAAQILRIYRIRFVNGRQMGQTVVFSRVIRPGLRATKVVGASAHSSMVGEASWYYVNDRLNAASPWLPFGTHVTVTNLGTGASVTVVINDRGPFGGRLIDLSEYAFSRIAPLGQGVCLVRISW
jgi:rare lipoprotein A